VSGGLLRRDKLPLHDRRLRPLLSESVSATGRLPRPATLRGSRDRGLAGYARESMSGDGSDDPAGKVLRHTPQGTGWRPPAQAPEGWVEAIEEHIAEHVAPAETVFHELVSDLVHLDVHMVPAGGDRDFHLLFTTGVSSLPMSVPEGVESTPYVELAVLLPASWPLTQQAWSDERWYWPVRALKALGRLPHEYQTWLGSLHTIPNGDPAAPYASNTSLSGMLLLPWVSLPPEASQVPVPGGHTVDILTLIPIHTDEMEFKLRHGGQALFRKLADAELNDVLDPARPSAVTPPPPRKRRFGIF